LKQASAFFTGEYKKKGSQVVSKPKKGENHEL